MIPFQNGPQGGFNTTSQLSLLFMCEHKEILLICYKPLIFTQIKQAEKTTCLTFIRKCFSFAFILKEHFKFKSRMSEIEWI